jgi:glutamyl-Q tRNA(Asp) synthetase
LDAKHHQADWLVRIEDIDQARSSSVASTQILHTLERFGLHWDDAVLYQHTRLDAYQDAFNQLAFAGHLYPCHCSRARVSTSAHGRYDNACKPATRTALSLTDLSAITAAWRFDTAPSACVTIEDRLQGRLTQNVSQSVGDFVVRRRNKEFTYQLAVVVDDAFQRITDVVRGADLLDNTPRQRLLQQALNLPIPSTLHLPVLVEKHGEKLSKSRQALAIDPKHAPSTLSHVLSLLGHPPPTALLGASVSEQLQWAIQAWHIDRLPHQTKLASPSSF